MGLGVKGLPSRGHAARCCLRPVRLLAFAAMGGLTSCPASSSVGQLLG